MPGKMLSAMHSYKPHTSPHLLGFLPVVSLALEKWQGFQDLHIFIFAFLNMKTIFLHPAGLFRSLKTQ
jgi:hypothetical protein